MARRNNRKNHEMRPFSFETAFTKHPEGSVLVSCGDTKVLCTASISEGVPKFLKDSNQGWLTAEYSMLPRSTHTRCDREATRGKQSGRTVEIQRLIGRCLRNSLDLKKLGDFTVSVDCDVIQADGGTRTTAINGAMVALILAIRNLQYKKILQVDPVKHLITAFSLGMMKRAVLLDLDYEEDSTVDVDCNICLCENGNIVEIQGSAEGEAMTPSVLNTMLEQSLHAQKQLLNAMHEALKN